MPLALIFPRFRQDIASLILTNPNHTCFLPPKSVISWFQPQQQPLSQGGGSKPSARFRTGTQTLPPPSPPPPRRTKPRTITYSCQTGNLGQIVRHQGPELKKKKKKVVLWRFWFSKQHAQQQDFYTAKGGGEDLPSASQASWSWLRSWKSSGRE